MERIKIDRINELSRKSKTSSLTPEEKKEQQELRQEYINAMKNDLKATLETISVVDKDGNKKKVEKRKQDNCIN